QVCLYIHDLQEPHFAALKRILRYVHSTLDYGLQLHSSSTSSWIAYLDADWLGCPIPYRSTSVPRLSTVHQRTKHIEIDIHYVRDEVTTGRVCVLHVLSRCHYADISTKGILSVIFDEFQTNLSVLCPSALIVRGGGIPGDLSLRIAFPGDMSPEISRTKKLEGDTFMGDLPGQQRRAHIVSVKQLSAMVEAFPGDMSPWILSL
nr:uncharacterized mitochondrial protein AtMg00810-like [Tanacetum cinerariifolium]